jgi:hypothetical protein
MRSNRALAILSLFICAFPALAVDRLVPSQYSTIQAAINAAENDDRILVGSGIYNERLNFIGKRLALKSERGPFLTILDPMGGGDHLIRCTSGEPAGTSIEGFTLRLTLTSAVALGSGSHVSISSCRFTSNRSDIGAAIRADNGSTLVLNDCEFLSNESGNAGGAIHLHYSAATITNCLFQNNVSFDGYGGGAICSVSGYDAGLIVHDCRFVLNGAKARNRWSRSVGGAISMIAKGGSITSCEFVSNFALNTDGANSSSGGSLYLEASSPTVSDCTFTDCRAGIETDCYHSSEASGGSVGCWSGSSPSFARCHWLRSTAISSSQCGTRFAMGGAVYMHEQSNPRFQECLFKDCRAFSKSNDHRDAFGGALYLRRAGPIIEDCEFDNCSAESRDWPGNLGSSYGGAIWCDVYASPFILGSSFRDGWAWRAGAIYMNGLSAPVIMGNLFQSNSGETAAGAIAASDSPAIIAENLFEANAAPEGSAIWIVGSQAPSITANYFCSNPGADMHGAFIDGGGNVVLETCSGDCNQNGVSDGWDVVQGLPDCDRNGILDVCDIENSPERDCDLDGDLDTCAAGIPDCDQNGVADTCQPDCDNNGTPDACEIIAGSPDCNVDGIPDACQLGDGDANRDGVLDSCQTVDFLRLTTEIVPISDGSLPAGAICYRVWVELAAADSRLFGFYGSPGKEMRIAATGGFWQAAQGADMTDGIACDATGPVRFDSWLTIGHTCDSASETHPLYEAGMDFSGFNSGGPIQTSNGIVFVDPDAPQGLAGPSRRVLIMQLTTLQPVSLSGQINLVGGNSDQSDWEAFEVMIPGPTLIDCNSNGTHDALDIASGFSADCDHNGIPDECGDDSDCNQNGILDACDIANSTSGDANSNGVPDECECLGDIDGNSDVDVLDIVEVLLAWGDPAGSPADVDGNGSVDTGDLALVLISFGGC